MGRRRSRTRGGLSRRRFLAGGLLSLGGASLLGGTQAFSQVDATRAASVQTTGDEDALLGLDFPGVLPVGVGNTDLVEVTNNTDGQLTASIDVTDLRASETFDSTRRGLDPGDSEQFTASVDKARATEDDAVDVTVIGSGPDIDVRLSRTVPVPSFAWQVFDNTQYGHVQFDVQYDVGNVPDFDYIAIEVNNTASGMSETYNSNSAQGTVTYPAGQEREWNAGGDEYEITYRAYDSNAGQVIEWEATITGGESSGEGDPGREDDPRLVEFTVTDDGDVQNNNTRMHLDYEVENTDRFQDVRVVFDNRSHDWSDATVTSQGAPTGSVVYPESGGTEGGVEGDTYDVTVRVRAQSGHVTDQGTVELVAADGNSKRWTPE